MLAEKILKALNEQLAHEERNSRIYLQMAGWCEAGIFRGVAKWFYKAAEDENKHKMTIATYIADKNEKFMISSQEAPSCEYEGILDLFTKTMETEKGTTASLNTIYRFAMTEGDYVTAEFLLPLLHEQIEEENKVQTVLDFIATAGTMPPGLALIDNKVEQLAG
jgi:ferritin